MSVYDVDGIILLDKIFVTPEMFGATGDGVADDTAAWQAAVDSGVNVKATNKNYRCGTINVTGNIIVDCNYATFTCTEDKLFNCTGTVTNTVQNAGNYVAYADFQGSTGYTGLAMLTSTDNVFPSRDYYYGGFVARFVEGICNDRRPVGFTGVTITEFDPIICTIKNIATVTHPNNPNYNYTINCTYGYNCKFENIYQEGEKYSIVALRKCLKCDIVNVCGYVTYTGAVPQYYPLLIIDSSETCTRDCDIDSDWWHCWTTGGNYICYNNKIKNCTFKSTNISLLDHGNAVGTIVENCVLNSCSVGAGGKIKDTKIISHYYKNTPDPRYAKILIGPSTISGLANYEIENVEFILQEINYENGIFLAAYPQVAGLNYYLGNVTIKNVSSNHNERYQYFHPFFYSDANTENVNSITFEGTITLDNAFGSYRNDVPDGFVIYGANAKTIIKNCRPKNGNALWVGVNASGWKQEPDTEILDSELNVFGEYNNLRLVNVRTAIPANNRIGVLRSNGGTLIADNIDNLENSSLLAFSNVKVTNMRRSNTETWLYAIVDSTNGSWYGKLTSSGIVHAALE